MARVARFAGGLIWKKAWIDGQEQLLKGLFPALVHGEAQILEKLQALVHEELQQASVRRSLAQEVLILARLRQRCAFDALLLPYLKETVQVTTRCI